MPPDRASPPGSLAPLPARARFGWLAWAGPAAVGAVLPLVAILASGRTLAWRDTARVFAPLRGLVVEALRDLRLPLWNPHEGTGMPLFAQVQHGVLQPVSLALAALWPRAGMDAFIVAYVLLAAVGAAILARRLGGSAGAAALAGLGFGLSGYVLSMSAVLPYLAGAAVAPWAVAALVAAEGPGTVALAGLAVAVLHFSGDPQWALAAALAGGALALEARGRRGLAGAAVAVALGTGLAAVQLVPAWAWLGETVRGQIELPQAERTQWALAPWRLLELLAPGFFQGTPGESLHAPVFMQLGRAAGERSFFASYDIPFVPSVFVGAGLLVLAAAGASASRRGRVLSALALVFLWTAMGRHLGADQLLRHVPIWGQFRYAEKMVGPFALCLALLAALGADRLASARIARWAAAAAAAAAVALAIGATLGAGWGERVLADLGLGPAAPVARWRLAVGLYHAAAALGALALLQLAAARRPAWRRFLAPAAAALVFAEGLAAAPFALHAGARGAREEDPLARLRGAAEVIRVGTPLRARPRQGPPGLDEADRAVAVESRMGVAPYVASSRIDQIETYVATPPLGLVLAENAIRWSWTGRRRYGVTHLVVTEPVGQAELPRVAPAVEGGRVLYAVPELGFRVWQVPHRPWASFAERALPVADRDEAFRALRDVPGEVDGVILEGAAPGGLSPGRVLSIERRPERLRIEAEASGDALLVVADAFWPGWKARLDGRPIPIQRADLLVRAVAWPAGRHLLEMDYQPIEIPAGISITAAAWLLAMGLVGWAWFTWRRSRA